MWAFNARQRRIIRWTGYPAFYLFCLCAFAYLTFPFDHLRHRIIAEFNTAQAEASGMRLQIDDMSWYWGTGIEAQGVRLTSPATGSPDENGKRPRPQVYEIQDLHVRFSLLRGLIGSSHVSFGLEAGNGEVEGYVDDDDELRTVQLEFAALGISGLPFLASAVGLPMTGSLSGEVELRLPEMKLSKGDGEINLQIRELAVGDGKAKIRDTIALPRLDAGQMELVAIVKSGQVKLETFSAKGPDLELAAEGKMRLRDPFATSLADLSLQFKFTDRYKTKNDMTKGLFGEPGSSTPGLFDLDAKNRAAKGADGFYAWRVSGPFSGLNFQPSRPTASRRKSSRTRRTVRRPRRSRRTTSSNR
jgi:type II secretion system protein N